MRATLIYNPHAGTSSRLGVDEAQDLLREAGFHPVYRATTSEEDLDVVLADAESLVVAVGGDGTLRAVATRVVQKEIPTALSLVPLGTANNVARQLGLAGTDPKALLLGLGKPRKRAFDVGRVRWPWGVDHFLEGAGFGFFADLLATYVPEEGKSLLRGTAALARTFLDYPVHPTQMRLDGQEVEGRFLLVEVMNTASMGPRMHLAPEASTEDGLFDVVRIPEDSRASFFRYLGSMVVGELHEQPEVEVSRVRKVEMTWNGFPFHLDAETRQPPEDWRGGPSGDAGIEGLPTLAIEVLPGALEFWLPGGT